MPEPSDLLTRVKFLAKQLASSTEVSRLLAREMEDLVNENCELRRRMRYMIEEGLSVPHIEGTDSLLPDSPTKITAYSDPNVKVPYEVVQARHVDLVGR